MKPKFFLFLTSLLFTFTLSGCWDLVEVDRLAFVTTIGIDIDNRGKIAVIVQIPLPQRMLPSSIAGRSQQGKQFSTTSFTARSVGDALAILQTKTYRQMTIEQNKSIIISELAASGGIEPLIEFFINNPKAPPQALVFIAHHHTAREILTFTPVQETLPGLEYAGAAQSAVKYDRTYFTSVSQFAARAIHTATDAYAPLLDLDQQEGMYIEAGLAAFDGFHLAGELDMKETQMVGLLTGLMKAGSLTLDLPGQGVLTLRNTSGRPRVKVKLSPNGLPFFSVQVNVNGAIHDLANEPKEITIAKNRQMELAIQKVLEQKMSKVIQKLQSYNSDIVNFGEEFRVQHHGQWKKYQWKQIFPQVAFKVAVKAKIERNGARR